MSPNRTPTKRKHLTRTHLKHIALGAFIAIVSALLILETHTIGDGIFHGSEKTAFYFGSQPESISIADTFSADLHVRTGSAAVNAVGLVIIFNPQYLQINALATSQSFCSFYTDNAFDNIKGEVRISCGLPSPGFNGDSIVAHITFHMLTIGTTTVRLSPSESMILANDGKGTSLTHEFPSFTITSKQST
jgi:hypothetical protein